LKQSNQTLGPLIASREADKFWVHGQIDQAGGLQEGVGKATRGEETHVTPGTRVIFLKNDRNPSCYRERGTELVPSSMRASYTYCDDLSEAIQRITTYKKVQKSKARYYSQRFGADQGISNTEDADNR
jgi:hypothetical protein